MSDSVDDVVVPARLYAAYQAYRLCLRGLVAPGMRRLYELTREVPTKLDAAERADLWYLLVRAARLSGQPKVAARYALRAADSYSIAGDAARRDECFWLAADSFLSCGLMEDAAAVAVECGQRASAELAHLLELAAPWVAGDAATLERTLSARLGLFDEPVRRWLCLWLADVRVDIGNVALAAEVRPVSDNPGDELDDWAAVTRATREAEVGRVDVALRLVSEQGTSPRVRAWGATFALKQAVSRQEAWRRCASGPEAAAHPWLWLRAGRWLLRQPHQPEAVVVGVKEQCARFESWVTQQRRESLT